MRPPSDTSPLVVVDFDDSKAPHQRGFLHISVTPPLPTKAEPSREPFCRNPPTLSEDFLVEALPDKRSIASPPT